MKESGYTWPPIAEAEQEQQLARMVGTVKFSEELTAPESAEVARAHYIASHPEQPLLAYVISQNNQWLRELAGRNAEKESDKFVMMAAINLVDCIAHAPPQRRRP